MVSWHNSHCTTVMETLSTHLVVVGLHSFLKCSMLLGDLLPTFEEFSFSLLRVVTIISLLGCFLKSSILGNICCFKLGASGNYQVRSLAGAGGANAYLEDGPKAARRLMAAKASLEQFDVILTAGPKGLDIEDEKLLNTLRSPKRTLEPESVGFPFVSHHNFSVPWETEGEILHHFVLGYFFLQLVPYTV